MYTIHINLLCVNKCTADKGYSERTKPAKLSNPYLLVKALLHLSEYLFRAVKRDILVNNQPGNFTLS